MRTRTKKRSTARPWRDRLDDTPLDLVTLALAGMRRWYLVVPLMVVTLAGAYLLNERIPLQLEARGQALLVPVESTESGRVRGVSLEEVAGELSNLSVQGQLRDGDTELEVRARGRSIELQLSGTDESSVVETHQRATQWLRDNVEVRQQDAGIPPAERFTLQAPTDASPTLAPDGRISMTSVGRLEEPASMQLNPHGSTRETVSLLAAIANGDAARSIVAAELGDDVTYGVTFRSRDAAPVLGVTIVAPNGRDALAGYGVIIELLEDELGSLELRAGVPSNARTVIERIAPPREVVDIGPTMERPVAAVLGLGALLSVGLVVLLEARDRGRLQPTDAELVRGGLLFPPSELQVPPTELDTTPWRDERPSSDRS